MAKTYLLGTMAVNIGNFIYDTHNISTIRGGSFILLYSANKLLEELEEAGITIKPICTKASKGLFFFKAESDEKAEEITGKALKTLLEHTNNHATFVADWEPLDRDIDLEDQEIDKVDISDARKRLTARLNRQQYRRPTIIAPEIDDRARECCRLDGLRPAAENWTLKKSGVAREVRVSESVYFRINEGIKLRKQYLIKLGISKEKLEFTDNLEELAHYGDGDGDGESTDDKIAVIHIDGNRFGKIDEGCKSAKDIKEFDKAKKEKIEDDFIRNLLKYAAADPSFKTSNGKLRMEILMWGGDEKLIVVPARKGWKTLQTFYESAGKGSASVDGKNYELTYSSGIVFCHHNAPILFMRKIAYELANKAKSYLGDIKPENITHAAGDSVHSLVLESFDLIGSDMDDFIDAFYPDDAFKRLCIKGSDIESLVKSIRIIQNNFPRGKVYDIVRCVGSGDLDRVKRLKDRALSPLGKNLRTEVEDAIRSVLSFADSESEYRWFLVAELWDFV